MGPYVFDDHDQEGQLDAERLLGVSGALDESGADIGAHDLQHGGLDVGVRDALDVSISDLLVPYLQRLAPGKGWRKRA
jgi:hypothetical protein